MYPLYFQYDTLCRTAGWSVEWALCHAFPLAPTPAYRQEVAPTENAISWWGFFHLRAAVMLWTATRF